MGNCLEKFFTSDSKKNKKAPVIENTLSKQLDSNNCKLINDRFGSFTELEKALRQAGLECSQLIIGIDYTKSNTWQGGMPYFYDNNLHAISQTFNPYQQVLQIMCKALGAFDDDQMIDAYGFGDSKTGDKAVFSLNSSNGYDDQPCEKLEGVLECYNHITPYIQMSGPTSFAPIIRKAIEIVKVRQEYHILLIIADGEVNDIETTHSAIVEASKYPLSIICVGVGRGPWDKMETMDDNIPQRKFDNFQFVNFYEIMTQCENETAEFAKHALMEIPDQYNYIKKNILWKN